MHLCVQALAIACASTRDCVCEHSRLHVRVLETRQEKMQRLGSLSTPSRSFTASLRSTNSPTFIKKYHKHVSCLLSRSCHCFASSAIIGPRLPCTCMSTRSHARVRVRALVHQGCILHPCAMSTPLLVTTSLFALICQVTCERFCTCLHTCYKVLLTRLWKGGPCTVEEVIIIW